MTIIPEYIDHLRGWTRDHSLAEGQAFHAPLLFVAEHGVEFKGVEVREGGVPNQCYRNAGLLVLSNPQRFTYIEGVAVFKEEVPLPVEHAWVYDHERGIPIETTWPDPGIEYLGVPFAFDFWRAFMVAREVWGLLDSRIMMTTEAKVEKFLKPLDFSVTISDN